MKIKPKIDVPDGPDCNTCGFLAGEEEKEYRCLVFGFILKTMAIKPTRCTQEIIKCDECLEICKRTKEHDDFNNNYTADDDFFDDEYS